MTRGRETERHRKVEQGNTESGGHLRILERWSGWGKTGGSEVRRRLSCSPGEAECHPSGNMGMTNGPTLGIIGAHTTGCSGATKFHPLLQKSGLPEDDDMSPSLTAGGLRARVQN